jgi:hypothetical protein
MALQEINTLLKDWVGIVTLIGGVVAVVGGLVAAFKAIHELRQSRKQRDEELRWKQANVAKQLLDELFVQNDYSENAVLMLDWNRGKRDYIVGKESILISYDDVLAALGKEQSESLSKKDMYIRECFDFFFYFIDRIQHYININLTNSDDVQTPLKPYAKKIKAHREVYERFMTSQDYDAAKQFLRQLGDAL